ncbi:hypothetical protein QUF63_11330 [Anaerolineales bacterium HSG25]|nr:hypothetical protein [Anaerolineales bacterium HSG25]
MTWPIANHLTTAIPGDGFDGWQNYWNLWWVREAMLVQGNTPYFTDHLYAPNGVSLLFHTLNIFNGLWTLPIQLNFGLTVAYNSVVLISFTLAGYGAYLLSLYVLSTSSKFTTRNPYPAAFVGGLVYTMSPFHMAHLLGHMQVFSLIWPPFYILWLLRTFNQPSNRPYLDLPNLILCALFLLLTTLVALYHTLYLLIFSTLTLIWILGSHLKERKSMSWLQLLRPLWQLLGIGFIFGLITSPLLAPMALNANQRPDLETGLTQNIVLSADLLAFVTPSELHPLWGEWATSIANNFTTTTSERLIFAGFTTLLLTLFIIIVGWRQKWVKYWTFISLSFMILALGPYLHVNGQIISLGDWPLPLPYLFLYHTVPFIDLTRSLSRYDLIVMLGLGVLVSLAIAQLQLWVETVLEPAAEDGFRQAQPAWFRQNQSTWFRQNQQVLKHACYLVPTGLILFEFLVVPYPMSQVEIPVFFETLGQDSAEYTIAELPMNWDRPTPLLHQTVHQKRLLTAYTSRNNPSELAWRTPVLQHWRYLRADIIDQSLAEIAPTIFYDFNLRYITLDYWQMPPGPEREATEKWLYAALPDQSPMYDDGRLKVYQAPPKTETRPYMSLGEGWSDYQNHPNLSESGRFITTTGTELFLHHPQNQSLTVAMTTVGSDQIDSTLHVFIDDTSLTSLSVQSGSTVHKFELPPIAANWVNLKFQVDGNKPIFVSRVALE